MKQFSIKDVRVNFEQVLDDGLLSGEPLKVTRVEGDEILVFEELWNGMTEKLNLLSIPGMLDAIQSGMSEILESTTKELKF